ncbi:MAG: uracil-DNA glycosylase [Burkholderiaceae bacterium]|nr:uracil-DNA glycosylase [Microbacteriaceae bacterium]
MNLDPTGGLDPAWAAALAPAAATLESIGAFLDTEAAPGFLPDPQRVLRAFSRPLAGVRVLIVGQDPYPTRGHGVGLSFSVDAAVRPLPRSLANIYRELSDDLGVDPPVTGDLSCWEEQGVLLLNRVLTVRDGAPGSHRGIGWEAVTDLAITALARRGTPLVALLWGKDAQAVTGLLGGATVVSSAHPSPLSARRGFFGSRPFSRANTALVAAGAAPIDWASAARGAPA